VDREGLDRLARGLADRTSRRGVAGAAVAAAAGLLGVRSAGAAAFDRNCSQFVLAGRDDRNFEHVDDNLFVEVQAKGSRRWKAVWDDRTDDNVNFQGEPFRIRPFRARVGDKIRISAYNVEGSCDLDEVWLYCANGRGTGKRVLSRYGPKSCAPGKFFEETFRIKP
jgi:hypothetical protein